MDLELSAHDFRIVVSNHSPFEGDGPACDAAYRLDASESSSQFQPTTQHAVNVVDSVGHSRSCMLITGGGPTTVHDHSALVHGQALIIAVGPRVCALRVPSLELDWNVEVDSATCFGIYYSAKHDCYVSHGELAIARVTLDGKVVWSTGGKDIFSEGFTLHDDVAEVIDFNRERYRIDLATGRG